MRIFGLLLLINVVAIAVAGSPGASQTPVPAGADGDDLSEVGSVDGDALSAMMKSPGALLIFDVRSREEYTVSHLARARLVDPHIDAAGLIRLLGRRKMPATVVFYCTIGQRSLVLAGGVAPDLRERGAKAVLVLDKGIVGWANAGRLLVDRYGATRFVHPYSQDTAKLLNAQNRVRFAPRTGARIAEKAAKGSRPGDGGSRLGVNFP